MLLTMCDMTDSSCGLLRLPDDLLWACLPERDVRWAVCRRLFNRQLMGSGAGRLGLCLEIRHAEDKRGTLVRMVNTFPALSKLKIEVDVDLQPEVLTTLLAPPPRKGPAWLSNIVEITISSGFLFDDDDDHLYVDSFVPQCIARACPHLERLKLDCVPIKQPSQWQPVSLPSLKVLHCLYVSIEMQPEAVRQQLQALPSLHHFKLATTSADFVSCCSSKVTELWGNPWGGNSMESYPLLHTLTVTGQVCPSNLMSMPKLMPRLRHLELPEFSLNADFKNDLSQLETLTVSECLNWGSMKAVHDLLVNTARPPKLHFRGGRKLLVMEVNKGSDAERVSRLASDFMAIMRRGGGLRRQDDSLVEACFDSAEDELLKVQQAINRVLCAVNPLDEVCLKGHTHVDTAVLTMVGGLHTIHRVSLAGPCTFEAGIWGSMVSLLPHVTHIMFILEEAFPVSDFQAFCSHAAHAVKVSVAVPYPVGSRELDMHVSELNFAAQGTLVQVSCTSYLRY